MGKITLPFFLDCKKLNPVINEQIIRVFKIKKEIESGKSNGTKKIINLKKVI